MDHLKALKKEHQKRQVILKPIFQEIPKRLWVNLILASEIKIEQHWADLSNKQLENLANQLTNTIFNANGKTTF